MNQFSHEEWRPVVGYEGHYEVSSLGRLRSLDRLVEQRTRSGKNMKRIQKGRILKPSKDTDGYYQQKLHLDGTKRNHKIHSLVLEAFVGPRPKGMVCRHGQKGIHCNEPSNLSYGTQKQNIDDKRRHGTMPLGEKHHNSRLTQQQVALIREDNRVLSVMSKEYGVSMTTISLIKRNKAWKPEVSP